MQIAARKFVAICKNMRLTQCECVSVKNLPLFMVICYPVSFLLPKTDVSLSVS